MTKPNNIDEIQQQYEHEKKILLNQYKNKSITKHEHIDFLQQLNNNENIDIIDAYEKEYFI